MPVVTQQRRVPWTPDQMYTLVADVGRYPEFLPWCAGARIRETTPLDDGREEMIADLIISFKVYRESFTSRVTLDPSARRVDVAYVRGPFKTLENRWRFLPADGGGTTVDFYCDFEFKNALLQRVVSLLFEEAMRRIIAAFERRAEQLYGQPTPQAGSAS